mgnify:CR=1 FL=1
MSYRLTSLLPCLCASVGLADAIGAESVPTPDNTPVWIIPAQDQQPNQRPPEERRPQPAMLELSGRGEESDKTENTQVRLMIGAPVGEHWRVQGEYEQGKLDTIEQPGPPAGDTQLARLALSYRWQRQEWRLGAHQGEGYDDYTGATLAQRFNLNPELTLEWQAAYHNTVKENPELQLYGMKNAFSTILRWRQGRYQVRAEAFTEKYYRQDTADQLGNGDGLRFEVGYQLFADNPQHWLTLVVRSSDYDQENGASLPAGAMPAPPAPPPPGQLPPGQLPPPPPKPPTPPAPSFVPKNAKEFGLIWTYGMANEREMSKQWRPIARAGISSDHEHFGYQYMVGVEGPVLGKDKLCLGYGENKNSQNQQNGPQQQNNQDSKGEVRKQVELRYQKAF